MNRRKFIKGSLSALTLTGLAGYGLYEMNYPGLSWAGTAGRFTSSLFVPPLLENLSDDPDFARFSLTVQRGNGTFLPGRPTPTMGYNGNFLGPTIRVKNGWQVKINVNNTLDERTTVHWHGLHVPAQWDGGPRQVIPAKSNWKPEFTIKQQAATLWYHPHAMGLTGEQVYKGLAGLFIIDDEFSENLDIPKTYGEDDFPIIIQDRRFFHNGHFAYVQNMMDVTRGVIGNRLLVNGAERPFLDVLQGKIRLRVLNGSNSSIYRIAFADRRTFFQIATDGGFLEEPVPLHSILLSAGERAEIVVDFARDELGANSTLIVEQLPGNRFEAMRFRVARPAEKKNRLPLSLASIHWHKEEDAVKTRNFIMETMSMGRGRMGMGMMGGGRLTINGKKMNMQRIDEIVKLGDTEIWQITNRSAMMMSMPHSMHLHDVQFQILDRNGRAPEAREKGRKDTVLINPGETVRIITRFEEYTGIYMYHCHLLEHEDDGMMGQFEVVS
ncbi:MAG: multicopper oxidase domain-containing protein [Desulfobulbaceae bacterium]|nr:multicopper oxidase domain-containing protein [Desulfobulbaceae bacterium]